MVSYNSFPIYQISIYILGFEFNRIFFSSFLFSKMDQKLIRIKNSNERFVDPKVVLASIVEGNLSISLDKQNQ